MPQVEHPERRRRREIQATDAEWQQISDNAKDAEMSLSEFIRHCAISRKMPMSKKPSGKHGANIEVALARCALELERLAEHAMSGSVLDMPVLLMLSGIEELLTQVHRALLRERDAK